MEFFRDSESGLYFPKLNRAYNRRKHIIQTAHLMHLSPDGKVIYEEWTDPNILHDEGEQYMLARSFATAYTGYTTTPATVYLGLDTRASLAEADDLIAISGEPSTGGYARQSLSTGGTGAGGQDLVMSQVTGAYRLTSKSLTFTHNTTGASWTGLLNMFLTDASSGTSGKLYCSVALSTSRTIANTGESLTCTIYIGLSE